MTINVKVEVTGIAEDKQVDIFRVSGNGMVANYELLCTLDSDNKNLPDVVLWKDAHLELHESNRVKNNGR
jgi:hypothetical protein